MSAQHSQGMWSTDTVWSEGGHPFCSIYAGDKPVAYLTLCPDQVEANAARIVACVNACNSIASPSAVPEAIDALTQIKMIVEDVGYCVREDTPMTPFIAALNDAYRIAEAAVCKLDEVAA